MADIYNQSMKDYKYGYGLFQPQTTEKLRPGLCGYIDESGCWQPLLDLTDNQLLMAAGYTPIGPLQRSDPQFQQWEPRVASTVKKIDIKLDGDGSALAAGLPIDVSVAFKYTTSTNFGAVLMCDTEVVVECYDHRDPFREWLKKNAPKLLANYPSLKEHGIYVATTTYSCSEIHINAWNKPQNSITLGCKVGVTGAGGIGPSVEWMRGSSTQGWTHYKTENGRKVVFFSGIKIIFRKLHFGGKTRTTFVPQSEWRGGDNKFSVQEPTEGGEIYEAELEMVGDRPDEVGKNDEENEEGDE